MLRVGSIVIRVDDLERQVHFSNQALGYERRIDDSDRFVHLYPSDGNGPEVSLDALRSEVQVPPRIHIDLYTDDRESGVHHLIGIGATEIPWDNRPPTPGRHTRPHGIGRYLGPWVRAWWLAVLSCSM
jgi:catechol 2,3-dioxygenase-like lactoylglutathione lyase family enzyme